MGFRIGGGAFCRTEAGRPEKKEAIDTCGDSLIEYA